MRHFTGILGSNSSQIKAIGLQIPHYPQHLKRVLNSNILRFRYYQLKSRTGKVVVFPLVINSTTVFTAVLNQVLSLTCFLSLSSSSFLTAPLVFLPRGVLLPVLRKPLPEMYEMLVYIGRRY